MKGHQMNAHPVRQALITALLLFGTAVSAGAQQDTAELLSGRTPGWSFTPGLRLGGVFDSNVGLVAPQADTQSTQSDRLVLAEPFGELNFLSRRTDFSSGYQGYLRRYMDLNELNGFDQRGRVAIRRLASKRLTLSAGDDYADVPTTDELELNGVPYLRTGSRRNAFSASADVRLTKFTDLSVKYDNTWVKFDRVETFLTGGWVNGAVAALSRRMSSHLSVGAEYGIRLANLDEGTRQLTFHDAGGTLHVSIAEHTSAALAAGVSYLNDRSFRITRTGPYVRAELTHDARRATVGASVERMFVPSFGFGGSNQSEQVRVYIRMPLDRNRLYLQGSAAWRRSDPFVVEQLRLDTTYARATVGYALARWVRLEGDYALTHQDTLIAGGKISRHRVGAQIVIAQPMRIH